MVSNESVNFEQCKLGDIHRHTGIFNDYVCNVKNTHVVNFRCFTQDKKQVAYMFSLPNTDTDFKKIGKMAQDIWKCRVCGRRAKLLSKLACKGGPFFCINPDNTTYVQDNIRMYMKAIWFDVSRPVRSFPSIPLKIYINRDFTKDTGSKDKKVDEREDINIKIYNKDNGSEIEKNENWLHYHIKPLYMSSPDIDVELLNSAFNIYAPLIWELLLKFDSNPHMLTSLQILNDVASESDYGADCKYAVDWLYKLIYNQSKTSFQLENLESAMELIANTIIQGTITNIDKGNGKKAFISAYHSVNNSILNFLLNARGGKYGLKKMLDIHYDPYNYRRCHGEAKESNIKLTMEIFKDTGIKTWVHTIPQLIELGAATIKPQVTRVDGMDVLNSMLPSKKKPNSKNYGQLASSIGSDIIINKHTTIVDLHRLITNGSIYNLKIRSRQRGIEYAYTGGYSMDPKFFIHDHLWSFTGVNIDQYSEYNITHLHLVETGKYGCGFFISNDFDVWNNVYKYSKGKNCIYPEFISPAWTRELRQVVEKLNKTYPIELVNPNESTPDLSYGIGVNQGYDGKHNLVSPIEIKINDSNDWFVITKFR